MSDQEESAAAETDMSVPNRPAILIGVSVVVALAALCVLLGVRATQARHDDVLQAQLVQAARQGAVNLTTIDYKNAEGDVQRILDSSTGQFRDDFEKRSQPFIDVVKKAKSTSVGTVTEAGLESITGEQGRVLVAVTVTTVSDGTAEEQPRFWRMRMTVDQQAGGAKVSNVDFVP